jgi:LacI family transcriptional regulator
MALGVLHVANLRGIAIPDDLAVVGFDGLDEAAQFTPSLTTVRQPLAELGRLAVRELLIAVDELERTPVRALTLAAELVVRESAPAPGQTVAAATPARPAPTAAEGS